MPETEWNSTTAPEEGAIVYVLAADNIGQYEIPFQVVFREAGETLAREKSSTLLSWDGAQLTAHAVEACRLLDVLAIEYVTIFWNACGRCLPRFARPQCN